MPLRCLLPGDWIRLNIFNGHMIQVGFCVNAVQNLKGIKQMNNIDLVLAAFGFAALIILLLIATFK